MRKSTIPAVLGAAAVATTAAVAAPANANPNWALYDVTHARNVKVGDVLSGYGKLVFTTVLNGIPTKIECRVPAANKLFTHTVVSTDKLTAAPGAKLSIAVKPPATISSTTSGTATYKICQDVSNAAYGSGVPIKVTTSQAAMTVSVTTPTTVKAGVFAGTLSGSLRVPAGEISFFDPTVNCGGKGPNVATTLTGSYATSSALLTPKTNQALAATATAGCTIRSTLLSSGAITLSPKLSLKY